MATIPRNTKVTGAKATRSTLQTETDRAKAPPQRITYMPLMASPRLGYKEKILSYPETSKTSWM